MRSRSAIAAVRIGQNQVAGVGSLRAFEPQSGLQMDVVAEFESVHHVAGRHPLLKVVVGSVRVLVRCRLVQRKLCHVCRQVRGDGVKAGYGRQIVAPTVVVGIGKRADELAHGRSRPVVIGGRVRVLPLVLVAELTSEFQSRCVRAEMIVDSHGGARLQVELRCLAGGEIDI